MSFDGPDVTPADAVRLETQLERVQALMKDGRWRTLSRIATYSLGSEASTSARLRDLRKERFGGLNVERRRTDKEGVWEYRILQPRTRLDRAIDKIGETTAQLGLALEATDEKKPKRVQALAREVLRLRQGLRKIADKLADDDPKYDYAPIDDIEALLKET